MKYNQMVECIRRVAKEVLGELKGKKTLIKKPSSKVKRFKKPFERNDVATKFGKRLRRRKITKCKVRQ